MLEQKIIITKNVKYEDKKRNEKIRLTQLLDGFNWRPKTARRHDLLLGRHDILQLQAGNPAQFVAGAFHDHPELSTHLLGRGIAQVEHGIDAHASQALSDTGPNAPYLANLDTPHPLQTFRTRHCMEVTHVVENIILLGQVVGELRQRLGRPDTNAHRQARSLLDAVTHLLSHGDGTTIKVGDRLDAQE